MNDLETAELKETFKASLRHSKQSSIHSSVSEKFSVPNFARESRVASVFDGYESRLAYLEDKNANMVLSMQ